METKTAINNIARPVAAPSDIVSKIETAMTRTADQSKVFIVITLQIENLDQFRKRRPSSVVAGLMREFFQAVRMAVHPSQYVSYYKDGLALVFEGVDVGHVDSISRRLVSLTQNVIRAGRYNDLTSRWTDILHQFLSNNPGILYSRVGWAIFPRDGSTAQDLLQRARNHAAEFQDRAAA